jgi:2-dehydro-3-deoxyphosphogluconate aldolase / (4S)-4-hydroxy-2-oxoglutarate aldolase
METRPASATDAQLPAIPTPILDGRVIAIGRGLPPDRLVPIAKGLAAGGVRAFEITLDSPDALTAIARLTAHFDPDELLVGAGTVMTVDAAKRRSMPVRASS